MIAFIRRWASMIWLHYGHARYHRLGRIKSLIWALDCSFQSQGYEIKVFWEPRDVWVGVFWDRKPGLVIFVCLVPMLPIRITFLADS